MDEESKKAKVINLMKESAPKRKRQPSAPKLSVVVNGGNGDGHGVGNTIIKTERHTTRTIAEPRPGAEHITEEQVRQLHDLKDEIVRLEAIGKKDPATPQRVWSALNKAMRVGAMRMIPLDKFPSARKYLHSWIGRLSDGATVQKKDADGVRKRRLAYIHKNMADLGCEERVRDYMEKHFGVRSSGDLPNAEALEQVYRYVASVKKEAGKKSTTSPSAI